MRYLLIFLCLVSLNVEAKIGLNISMIYKKGIGKGFFLSTEQHSIEQVDDYELVAVQMKNGIRVELQAFYVQSVHEYGPSGFVRIKGDLYNQNGKLIKSLNTPALDIYLGDSKTVIHEEKGQEQIDLTIKPVSL